jgi:hypothetical protein
VTFLQFSSVGVWPTDFSALDPGAIARSVFVRQYYSLALRKSELPVIGKLNLSFFAFEIRLSGRLRS